LLSSGQITSKHLKLNTQTLVRIDQLPRAKQA
jgi:hypothetical protein